MRVEPHRIDTEAEADSYLKDLLENPEYRSMTEVHIRARKYRSCPRPWCSRSSFTTTSGWPGSVSLPHWRGRRWDHRRRGR